MRCPLTPFLISVLLSLTILGSSMTDLDYRLSNAKYSDSSITDDESFHGTSSAMLSVKNAGSYARIMIYLDKPIPIEDLDIISLQMDPILGDGNVQIEIFLDGDGDDAYSTDSSNDARLRTIKEPWSNMGIKADQWNELDGTEMTYEKYGDKDFGSRSFGDSRKALSGKMVIGFYITIYKDSSVDTTAAYIDYIKIGDRILSFEPLEEELPKSAPKSASPGSEITYTITYGNNFLQPLDLVIRESYDPKTIFVSADPAPDEGTNNIWTVRDLPPGKHGQIKIKVRTERLACDADIGGRVSGSGYASSSGRLSTDLSGYTVTNSVDFLSSRFNLTASASTLIRPVEGSVIAFREHGSGLYSAVEEIGYSAARIFAFRKFNASQSSYETNTSPALLSGLFKRSWYASCLCEDRANGMMLSEAYAEGRYLDLDSRAYLSKKSSYFETASSFSGLAEYDSRLNGAVSIERFAGNFSTTSKTRVKSERTSKSNNSEADLLECCPEISIENPSPEDSDADVPM